MNFISCAKSIIQIFDKLVLLEKMMKHGFDIHLSNMAFDRNISAIIHHMYIGEFCVS